LRTKRIAFYCLHYGAPYLYWSIRSVVDAVDRIIVLYSPYGSHGTRVIGEYPPAGNSERELQRLASGAAGGKLTWVTSDKWVMEGQHRDAIYALAPNAEAILTVDYDEIWPSTGQVVVAMENALRSNNREFRYPFVHFWRSFHRAILYDPAFPVRIVTPAALGGEATLSGVPVAHMGYAIPPDLMAYKWTIHGHKNELRRDVRWLEDVYIANKQTDCHPVGSEFWNAKDVEPAEFFPQWMRKHPYYDMEVIE